MTAMNRRSLFKFLFGGAASVAAAKLAPPVENLMLEPRESRLEPALNPTDRAVQEARIIDYWTNPIIYCEEDGSTPDLPDFTDIRPGGLYASRGHFRVLRYPGQAPLTGVVKT
jgi:hypothetical protein